MGMFVLKVGRKKLFENIYNFKKLINFDCGAAISSKALPEDGLPIVGSLFSFILAGSSPKLHLYVDAKHSKLGPVFREVMPSRTAVFLSDPDKIREVFSLEGKCPKHFLPESWLLYNRIYKRKRGLLFMEKEEWQHYRKIMNAILLKDDVFKGLDTVYGHVVESLVSKWKNSANSGRHLENLERDMYQHSISFMLATAMGSSYQNYKHLFESDLLELSTSYQKIFDSTSELMALPVQLVSKLNLPSWSGFVKAMDESLGRSSAVLNKMKGRVSEDGLIRKLLDFGVGERMTSILITDLMMAAGDTTAYTLQWALYLLGKHRDVQQEAANDDDIIRAIIKETLRLYPAAPFLTRQLDQPFPVPPYKIPPNEMIIMSMYTSSRSPLNFPFPNQFRPGRWLRDSNHQTVLNRFASLPYALGVRSCVGKKTRSNHYDPDPQSNSLPLQTQNSTRRRHDITTHTSSI